MAATKKDVDRWIEQGKREGAKFIVSVCDTFSWDDYPVYVMPGDDLEAIKKHYSQYMQKVNEVIVLEDPIVMEAKEFTPGMVFNYELADRPDPTKSVIITWEKTTMNAARARELTEENILNSSNNIKKKIDDLIEHGVEKKVFSITFDTPPLAERDVLEKHFKSAGYTWQYNSGGYGGHSSITLSW